MFTVNVKKKWHKTAAFLELNDEGAKMKSRTSLSRIQFCLREPNFAETSFQIEIADFLPSN